MSLSFCHCDTCLFTFNNTKLNQIFLVDAAGERDAKNFQHETLKQKPPDTSSKPSRRKKPYLLVAAIDFGTTFSGWAFAFLHKPKEVRVYKNWGEEFGIKSSSKTPTSVLVDGKGKFVAFGYTAEQEYENHCANSRHSGGEEYDLFRHFKMALFREQV